MAEEQSDEGKLKDIENRFKDWILSGSHKDLNLLISGKTGVGKSRFVNALVGQGIVNNVQEVAQEGQAKDPCTSRVACYQRSIANVNVTVWDSPGLQDGTTNEDRYIQDMKNFIKDIALMIYCVRMDDTRFYEADKKAIRTLTDEFGKEVWNHAVVALTFANKVEDPDGKDELKYFQSQLKEWKKQFNIHFAAVGLNPKTCSSIPVIPVGNMAKSMRLPDRENWLSDLWIECYEFMKFSARLGMYRINKNRLMFGGSTATAERGDDHDDEFSIPIPLNDQQLKSFLSSTWEAFVPVLTVAAIGIAAPEIAVGSVIALQVMASVAVFFRWMSI